MSTFFSVLTWGALALLGAVLIAIVVLLCSRRYRDSAFDGFWSKVGLPIDSDELEISIRARVSSRARGIPIVAVVSLVATALVFLITPGADPLILFSQITLPAVFILLLGSSARAVGPDRAPDGSPVKSAPSTVDRSVRLSDYLNPLQLFVPWILMAVTLTLLLAALVLGASGAIDSNLFFASPAIATVIVTTGLQVSGFVAMYRALRWRAPVMNVLAAAWDDAFLAASFRNIVLASSQLAVLGAGVVLYWMMQGNDAVTGDSTSLIAISTTFLLVATVNVVLAPGNAANRFRRRLWPQYVPPVPGSVAPAMRAAAEQPLP